MPESAGWRGSMWTTRASLGHARWGCRARGGHLDAEPAVEGVGTGPSPVGDATLDAPRVTTRPRAPPRLAAPGGASPRRRRAGAATPRRAPRRRRRRGRRTTPKASARRRRRGEAPADWRKGAGGCGGCGRGSRRAGGGTGAYLATPRLDLNETAARERRCATGHRFRVRAHQATLTRRYLRLEARTSRPPSPPPSSWQVKVQER